MAVLLGSWFDGSSQARPEQQAAAQSVTRSATSNGEESLSEGVGKGTAPYRIGAGDILHVSVWHEPQLDVTAEVRPDGMITMPLIAAVPVVGLTTESAGQTLTERYERYVHKPVVTVVVQEIRSRTVYVTGEVMRPGAYPLVNSMNVVQLVSRAGGPTDFAKRERVYVLRAADSRRLNVNYRKVLQGDAPEENVQLSPGDTVVVP